MRKGMSLPVETVIVLVLAIIVLAALLFFFTGTFTPGADRVRLEQRKVDLCTKYVAADSQCKNPATAEIRTGADGLDETCKKLGLSTVAGACCSTYCPNAVRTRAECVAAGGGCQVSPCTANTVNTKAVGRCDDEATQVNCCKSP